MVRQNKRVGKSKDRWGLLILSVFVLFMIGMGGAVAIIDNQPEFDFVVEKVEVDSYGSKFITINITDTNLKSQELVEHPNGSFQLVTSDYNLMVQLPFNKDMSDAEIQTKLTEYSIVVKSNLEKYYDKQEVSLTENKLSSLKGVDFAT